MKIEITEKIDIVKEIEIDLPYYYKHDLSGDRGSSIIYGKITETKVFSIQEKEHSEIAFEFEIDEYPSLKQSGLTGYFKSEYKSTKSEYEEALKRANEFIKEF
jgi:hypothetical protein